MISHRVGVDAHVKTSAGFDDQVPLILDYTDTDPYAMTLTFDVPEGPSWVFSRDLVSEALDTPGVQGPGDVQVLNDDDGTVLIFLGLGFEKGAATAAIKILRTELVEFLDRTYNIVRRGEESSKAETELDSVLADLLAVEGGE